MACTHLISNANADDILKYDPKAEQRAATLNVVWDDYLAESSDLLWEDLESAWYPKYAERLNIRTTKTVNGKTITTFDKECVDPHNTTLIRLHVFKTLVIFYSNLITDVSNVDSVGQANYAFAKHRYDEEWQRLLTLNNIYDINKNGQVEFNEKPIDENGSLINKDRRRR